MNLKIRNANNFDKISVLEFCKNTFSWGDYVEHVWDFWLSEGHLFLGETENPVGICHAFYSHDQIWIEGIRIKSNSRRQNIASKLVKHAEIIGKERNLSTSYMLIDTENSISLSMANSLNYEIFQTWNFYSLNPKINLNHKVTFEKSLNRELYPQYVKSWRWLSIDDATLKSFYDENNIVKSCIGENDSIGILSDSEHFDKTLIVTLFSNSD
jgi:N-acetylglutamate synthase-like GNAT family acetyltransferase